MSVADAVVLDDLIRHRLRTTPEATAILHGERSITYGELAEEVDRAARMLGGLGIGRGDRVGLMFPNRPEMLALYFACFRMGAIVVPVNTRYVRDEIEYALDNSGTRLLLVDHRFLETVKGLDAQVASLERILVLDGDLAAEDQLHVHLANAPAEIETPQIEPEDPAVILYTSGSTSRPKGVTHSHFSLLGSARIQAATREIGPDTVWLVSTGVGYIAGLAGVTLPAFRAGCTLVLVTELTPDNLLRAIDRHRADTTLVLPTMLLEMLDSPLAATADLSSLACCFVAGDESTPDLYERFQARMGHDLLQAFGMTECEGYLTNRRSGPSRKLTVGVPAEGVRLRLLSPDGKEVAVGERGEVVVQGDNVMVGYWGDPDATADALRDGWLYGGDVASRDEDGFYIFHERKREIVMHGGSIVGPHEVEDVIDAHPDVKESCVTGVPDPLYGEVLEAYVEWEPGTGHVDLPTLKAWVGERLAAYKVPDRWRELEELPRTATGKIDRKRLHEAATAEGGASSSS